MYGTVTYGPSSCQGCVNQDPAIQNFQVYLQSLGYGPSAISGIYGSETYQAVQRFQRDYGLGIDGRILSDPTSETHSALKLAASGVRLASQTLSEGGTVDPEQARLLLELAGQSGDEVNIMEEKWFWPAVVGVGGLIAYMYWRGRKK